MSLLDAPSVSVNQLASVSNRVGYPFPFTVCASRLIFPNANFYSAASPTITHRSSHVVMRSGNVLRIGWLNQSFNGTASNAYTLTASVQVAPSQSSNLSAIARTILRFNGSLSVSVPVDGFVVSDPIFLNIEQGNVLFVKSCCASVAATNNWPIGLWLNRFNEGTATGDQTQADVAFTSAGQSFSPAMIGTQSTSGKWIAATGDSILDGSNDDLNSAGFFDRWQLSSYVSGTRLAVGGETIADAKTRFSLRWQMAAGATHALSQGGGNDISGGATLAAIQASMIGHWRDLYLMGLKVYQATTMPRPTSSDNWITASNQTAWTADSTRISVNNWLRAGAPVVASGNTYLATTIGAGISCPYLTGCVDICAAVEVNSSNVLTTNGGRLIAGASISSRTATGGSTTSIVDTGTNFNTLSKPVAGCFVRITAGAGSGQSNWIVGAATNTQINLLNTFGVAVNATSVYEIIDTPTRDGVHPSGNLHQVIANYLTANFVV